MLYLVGYVGAMVIALGLTVAVILLVRVPLMRFLEQLIADEVVARLATTFVLLLLFLRGLEIILGFVTQPDMTRILGGLTTLLLGLAEEIQWVAEVAALLFIGYAIRGRWGTVADRREAPPPPLDDEADLGAGI